MGQIATSPIVASAAPVTSGMVPGASAAGAPVAGAHLGAQVGSVAMGAPLAGAAAVPGGLVQGAPVAAPVAHAGGQVGHVAMGAPLAAPMAHGTPVAGASMVHAAPGAQVAPGTHVAPGTMTGPPVVAAHFADQNPASAGAPLTAGLGAASIPAPVVTPINIAAPVAGTHVAGTHAAGTHLGAQVGSVPMGTSFVPGTPMAGLGAAMAPMAGPQAGHVAMGATLAAPFTAPMAGTSLAAPGAQVAHGTQVAHGSHVAHGTTAGAHVVAAHFGDLNPSSASVSVPAPGTHVAAHTPPVTVPLTPGPGVSVPIPAEGAHAGHLAGAPVAGATLDGASLSAPLTGALAGPDQSSPLNLTKISLDINEKVSTDTIKYRRDDPNKTDIWYALDGYIINEIRVGNNKRWPPEGEVKECKKVMFIIDAEGKKTLRVIYPEEEDAYDPDNPPVKTGADGSAGAGVSAGGTAGVSAEASAGSGAPATVLTAPMAGAPHVDPNQVIGMGQGMPTSVTIPLAPETDTGAESGTDLEALLSATDPSEIPQHHSPPAYKQDQQGQVYLEFSVPDDKSGQSGTTATSGFTVEEIHATPRHGRTIEYHDSDDETFPRDHFDESPLDITTYVTRVGRRVGALEERMDAAEGTIKLLTMTLDYQHQILDFKREFGDKKAPFGADLGTRAKFAGVTGGFPRFGADGFRPATSQMSKELAVTEHPSDVKLLVIDPNDATKFVDLDTNKYKVKQEGDEIHYLLDPGVECKLVTYQAKSVWSHRNSDPHPIGVVFYPDDDKVVVDFVDAIVMYVKKGVMSKEGLGAGERAQAGRKAVVDISLKELDSDGEDITELVSAQDVADGVGSGTFAVGAPVARASAKRALASDSSAPLAGAPVVANGVSSGVVAEGVVPSEPVPSEGAHLAGASVVADAAPLASASVPAEAAQVASTPFAGAPVVVNEVAHVAGTPVAGAPLSGAPLAGAPVVVNDITQVASAHVASAPVPAEGAQVAGTPVAGAPLAGAPVAGAPVAGAPVVPGASVAAPAGQPAAETALPTSVPAAPAQQASAAPIAQAQPAAQTAAVPNHSASPVPAGLPSSQSAPVSSSEDQSEGAPTV
ncbi:conserved hypothetical protein [Theileria orientalis strain Shintoku]|uniref:Uncharacterized protein n=1 Tax=Theileria orientalis strain Shintoku TaxID=869250 RepID=J4C8E1_THEOR|nr:conserved hypothetical protein [Theileria orientalis strain Shintoku]BAM40628.1 conserved hypothetical protein [Theileria orientalis strain Shintoku]|eukprot:XP_009690929.1 conserved hypothetical protein [Theileria orientalis strain Shintoku]